MLLTATATMAMAFAIPSTFVTRHEAATHIPNSALDQSVPTSFPVRLIAASKSVRGIPISLTFPENIAFDWANSSGSIVAENSDYPISFARVSSWMDQLGKSATLTKSLSRLSYLSSMKDGWKGRNSRAATEPTLLDCLAVVEKLNDVLPSSALPDIGLDEEGYLNLSWQGAGLVGSLSVYGDGTYSFFARSGARSASSDSASIAGPLDSTLTEILRTRLDA